MTEIKVGCTSFRMTFDPVEEFGKEIETHHEMMQFLRSREWIEFSNGYGMKVSNIAFYEIVESEDDE